MKNILLFLLSFFLLNQLSFSQENNDIDVETDEILENIILLENNELIDLINELNKYQVIFTSVDFSNKTYFLGRDLGLDQYNITSQAMYQNSNGIFIGVSGTYYSDFDPKWDLTVLTGGYGKGFGKEDNFRAELSYSRYIFSDSDSNDFENSLDVKLDIATNKRTIGASLSSAYLFGNRTGFQADLSIYSDLKLFDLSKDNDSKISFQPDLSFQFASENIDTSRFDDLISDFPFIDRIVDSFEKFSLRNIQLQLPLVLEFNDFQIEAGYNINFPSAFDFENSVDNTTFFNIGLNYMFTIK